MVDHEVTRLLQQLREGDGNAADRLMPLLYAELHSLAAGCMRDQRGGHTLQPTALVNEAYVRLVKGAGAGFENRQHFLAVAAKAMRSVLVDHARRRAAQKRGEGGDRLPLAEDVAWFDPRGVDLLALEDALLDLGKLDPELVRVVELLFFAGLTAAEAAEVLGVSSRTVERGWRTARAVLYARLAPDAPPSA